MKTAGSLSHMKIGKLVLLLVSVSQAVPAFGRDCHLKKEESSPEFPAILDVTAFVNRPYGESFLNPQYPEGTKLLAASFKNQPYRDSPTIFFTGFLNALQGYQETRLEKKSMMEQKALYYTYRSRATMPELGEVTLTLTPFYDRQGRGPVQKVYRDSPLAQEMFTYNGAGVIDWVEVHAYRTKSVLSRLFSDRAYTHLGSAIYRCY